MSEVAAPGPRAGREAESPSAAGRATLIVNPIATTVSKGDIGRIERSLGATYEVEIRFTEAPGHATQLAQEAVDRGDALVAVYAGDGTTNEAIQALAGTQTALAHIPGGSASVLARVLGMGGNGPKAAQLVAGRGGATDTIDLGVVNDRFFAFTAGIGLDGAVVRLVDGDLERKQRLRWTAFWLEAVRVARTEYFGAPASLTIRAGGEELRAVTAVVQNSEAYTYAGPRPLTVATDVSLTSGTLQATGVLEGLRWLDVPALSYRTLSSAPADGHPRIQTLPASTEVEVLCDRPMPLQVDGDYWQDVTAARYSVRPGALRVVR